jgi:hypothetical protein
VDTKLSETIRQNLRTRLHIEKVLIEEIIHQPGGYGVASVIIAKDSKIAQHTLEDLGLKDSKIIVLSIERDGSTIPQPVSKTLNFALPFISLSKAYKNLRTFIYKSALSAHFMAANG